ncbi:MAG: hypothetical protein AABN34_20990 [Acidobacteriota bacterium]
MVRVIPAHGSSLARGSNNVTGAAEQAYEQVFVRAVIQIEGAVASSDGVSLLKTGEAAFFVHLSIDE